MSLKDFLFPNLSEEENQPTMATQAEDAVNGTLNNVIQNLPLGENNSGEPAGDAIQPTAPGLLHSTIRQEDNETLANLKTRRRYSRGSFTRALNQLASMLHEEEEEASANKIIGCFESLKAKYEGLRAIEQQVQELTSHDFLEEEIKGFAN